MMRNPLILLLVSGMVLGGCASWRDSRVNPGNWFGGGRTTTTVAAPDQAAETGVNPLIPQRRTGLTLRPEAVDTTVPIANVTELRIERTPSGAIIYATGVASRQGAYGAELRPDSPDLTPENGVLSFTFRVSYPRDPTPVGSERTRTVIDAISLSRQELDGVRTIRVSGAGNALESRRR